MSKPKPARLIIYGPSGIGKTTLPIGYDGMRGSDAPVFVLTEDGLGDLVVPVIGPETESDEPSICKSFEDVLEALVFLGTEEHDFKTVVIDSLDWLEPLIWNATCRRLGVSSIEAPGYGKGYVEAGREWYQFFEYLTALRDSKQMTVVLLAHSQIIRVEDPQHPAYDMHGLKLHKRAAALSAEYADVIGFASTKTFTTTEEAGFGQKRTRAVSTGERVLHLVGSAAYVAKNRYHMPDSVNLTWESLAEFLPHLEE